MVKSKAPSRPRQHCWYFLPLTQRHGSLRPGFIDESLTGWADVYRLPASVSGGNKLVSDGASELPIV